MNVYRVDVERDEHAWMVTVPHLDKVTMARTLREVDFMARDLVYLLTDEPVDSFDLDVHVQLPDGVQAHLDRAEQLRRTAAESQTEAAAEVRVAARALAESGFTLRDIGRTLDVSYQRAHQLVTS